ncbi:MAG: glycosyltransferase family 4 protein [Proteobacteria bacterium]|nr:glycosyltransferase family 4 protein [Pseudomonadota bacterium]
MFLRVFPEQLSGLVVAMHPSDFLGLVLYGVSLYSLSLLGTLVIYRVLQSRGVLDVPNERSSHTAAVPRGGGAALFATTCVGVITLLLFGQFNVTVLAVFAICGGAIATVGLIDDVRGASVTTRLAVHLVAACVTAAWALFVNESVYQQQTVVVQLVLFLAATIGIVGFLNVFNFMDGIDGLAAAEALFVGAAAAFLMQASGKEVSDAYWLAVSIAAAAAGFMMLNWAPARIFMGDIGSGFLGFSLAFVATLSVFQGQLPIYVWLILTAAFTVDASLTLLMRAFRGERVYEAHRSHAYQRLSRRLGSHGRVATLYSLVNVVWLLPLAWLSSEVPNWGIPLTLVAVAPLMITAFALGAGKND